MLLNKVVAAFIGFFFLLLSLPDAYAQLTPVRLRCEHLENPLGIDVVQPRLSWELTAKVGQRAQRQTAWRVVVSSSLEKSKNNQGDLWDSGKVESSQSILVAYSGKPLASRQRCWWKVMAWDANDQAGEWSEPHFWEMALLDPNDWNAKWVACSNEEHTPPPLEPAPMFRREFSVKQNVKRARAYITGLGYFEMTLNGEKVGDHELDPVKSRYDRRIYYVTHDLTDLLNKGDNAVGVTLGTGWFNMHTKAVWGFGQAPWRARPRMLCQVEIEYQDGSNEIIVSDSTWKVSAGPIVFDAIRNGETYDARLEKNGWNQPGYNDDNWSAANEVDGPGGELSAQMLPPIRVTKILKPKSVTEVKPGVWVYDFDQNMAAKLELTVQAPAGTKISMKQGERLYPDGTVEQKQIARFIKSGELQTDTYICNGSGQETWEPRFVYHGFQYVEVSGLPEAPDSDLLWAKVVNTDFDSAGSFECSNDLLNSIQKCTRWSFIGNYHGIPTDCPHREKIGWTGDAHIVGETGLFNYDMAASYTKWIRDFADEQRENGDLPGVVPTSGWGYEYGRDPKTRDLGYGPQWEGAYVILSWHVYVYTGDLQILKDHYDGFCRYLDHLTKNADDGIIRFGIDDHAPAITHTPPEDFATGFYYQIADIVSQTAALLGKEKEAEKYSKLRESIQNSYNKYLYDADISVYASGSQTAQSAPLYFGIIEPESREKALSKLLEMIEENDDHLDAGVVGTKFLINSLVDHGRADVAYKIITQTTFPSWGDWVQKGANTLWQKWDDSMSRNHIMFGDVSAWMFKNIAGINPDADNPGFKHFFIKPNYFSGLKWARAEHHSPYGLIKSSWKKSEDQITLDINVPVNCSATVSLPGRRYEIKESGKLLADAVGVIVEESHETMTRVLVQSGHFQFVVEK
jgi:alpha-L-rhamnosidase